MIILVGPSASGKTEIAKILIKEHGYQKFVTTTTRNIRINEKDNVDYHFINKDQFINKIKNDEFIEYVSYNDNFYGTEKKEIDKNKVLIVEPQGLKHFKTLNDPSIVSFYISVKKEIRKERMIKRQDKIEDINKRLICDDKVFNNDVLDFVDFTIENNETSLKEISSTINEIYKKVAILQVLQQLLLIFQQYFSHQEQ